MTLSKVETFIFGVRGAHFVTSFELADGHITVGFTPMENELPNEPANVFARFAHSVMVSIWEDSKVNREWPLDVIGFDSYSQGNGWKFVLNCDSVEWSWESDWPELSDSVPQ